MLKLSILGPPKVERSGEPAGHFVSIKALALLCYLAMRDGPQVREHLAGLLWGEMPEARAKANLRMALYSLQKLLPDSLILTRLTVAFNRDQPYWLDVEAFKSGLTEEEPIANIHAVLDLYRGEFLENLYIDGAPEFEVWLLEQREYFRLSFLRALERLAAHYMAQANWVASIDTYRRLLDSDPLREDIHRRLMLALARSGRYESALEQYESCRCVLLEELRVEPTHETKALCERIQSLRAQPNLHNIPTRHDPLLGREKELEGIARLLQNSACRLITLIGPGGIGKSRLALQIASDKTHEGTFLEGEYFVQLAGIASPDLLAAAIADAIHFGLQGSAEPAVQLCKYLQNREMLLVLDNFEHLIHGGTKLITEILINAPDVKLMITSRERLNLQEEWLLEVQGLQFPKPPADNMPHKEIAWNEAKNYPAIQLFRDRAKRIQSDFSLSKKDIFAVVRICQLVEGMPLGIELAATWVRSVSCTRIADEIEHNLGFLSVPQHDMSERHQSIQVVFNHSWQFLSTEEEKTIKRLSVFRGGFRGEAAEFVAGASLSVLSSLVDKSFLHRNPVGRFEIHELLRQYAEEKLCAVPQEVENTRNIHCKYFASFLHERENHLKSGEQMKALQEISTEIDNIRAAWQWAVENNLIEEIGKSLEGLWAFFELRGWYREGKAAFRNAISRLKGTIEEHRNLEMGLTLILGAVLSRCGWFCWHQGQYRQCKELLQESLLLLQVKPSAWLEEGFAILQLGIASLYLGEYLDSRQFFHESREIFRKIGDHFRLTLSYTGLYFVSLALGEYANARQWLQESLACFDGAKDRRGRAHVLIWFGWTVQLAEGESRKAELLIREGIAICQELNDKYGLGLAFAHLGKLFYLRGDYLQAKQLHQKSIDNFQEIDDLWGLAYALNGLGFTNCRLEQSKFANHNFCKSLGIAMEAGTLPLAMEALVGIASLIQAGEQEEKQHALELLEFVIGHSATTYETKDKASRLIAALKTELPLQVVDTAQNRRPVRTLETFVEDILGQALS